VAQNCNERNGVGRRSSLSTGLDEGEKGVDLNAEGMIFLWHLEHPDPPMLKLMPVL
jgi:hypothetical protein